MSAADLRHDVVPQRAARASAMLPPRFERMPLELRSLPRWVTHRKKVPYDPSLPNSKASVTDPTTWATFELAAASYEEGGRDGVGFVLAGDGIAALDVDRCVKDGVPDPTALELLNAIGAHYIELSPSGTGLHAWGLWPDPFPGRRGEIEGLAVEIYSRERYLTMTGHPLLGKDGPLGPLSLEVVFGRLGLQKTTEATEDYRGYRGRHKSSSVSSVASVSSVEIPSHTLPAGEGERNRQLFVFARWLRGKYPDATADEMRPWLEEWHRRALPFITTKLIEVSWGDFRRGWEKVRIPHGAVMTEILESIDHDAALPDRVLAKGYGPETQHLVRVCLALQEHAGDGEFFLGCRQAGEILGVHYTAAASVLSLLVDDGILELVSKGSGRLASRYRVRG